MHRNVARSVSSCRSFAALVILVTASVFAQGEGTKITPPKNKYILADDIKAGQEAAAQVRRTMPLLPKGGESDSYVERVGQRLVAAIPPEFAHSEFHYEFSVVNASDINAFALPGGPMFVNRGMIEAAHTEGEMAGVMAHELSHVALRHGTAQATKSQSAGILLGELSGAILGAVIGGNVGDVVSQGTQMGLGTYMLKFSRKYETQADLLGAQIMARAGYDPKDLANMFKTIEEKSGSGGPQWLSDHPNPGNRYERITSEASKLSIAPIRGDGDSQEFARIQSLLKQMPPAPTMAEISKASKSGAGNIPSSDTTPAGNAEPPVDRYRTFDNGRFRLSIPDSWREFADNDSVTFAPSGAYGAYQGQSVFTHGAIVGVTNVSSGDLVKATDQFIAGVIQGNAYLQVRGDAQRTAIDGKDALKRSLTGISPVTRRNEAVDVYSLMTGNGQLFYMVQVVPNDERRDYKKAFAQMVKSVALSH